MGGGCFAAGAGTGACFGGGSGADISKRSPIVLLAAGGLFADVTGDGADEKSPKSAPKLLLGGRFVAWIGGDVGFEAGAGFASKNPPPLSGGGDLI